MIASELHKATLMPFVVYCVSLSLQKALHRFNSASVRRKGKLLPFKSTTILIIDHLQDADQFADKLHVHRLNGNQQAALNLLTDDSLDAPAFEL